MTLPRAFHRPVSALLALLVTILRRSVRVRVAGGANLERALGEGGALALLHGEQLLLASALPEARPTTLVGLSADGSLAAAVLARLRIPTVRGSSSNGAFRALRGLVRSLAGGQPTAVTVDGPRGPSGTVAPGLVAAAMNAGRPIYPVIAAARPCLRLGSWDRFCIPLPGARVLVLVGGPLLPSSDGREGLRARVERDLARLTRRADRLLGRGR